MDLSFLKFDIVKEDDFLIISSTVKDEKKLLIISLLHKRIAGIIDMDYRGEWIYSENSQFLICEDATVSLYEIKNGTAVKCWEAELPEDLSNGAVYMERIEERFLIQNKNNIYVLDHATGKILSKNSCNKIIGVSKRTNEVISYKEQKLYFHSVLNNKERIVDLMSLYNPGQSANSPVLVGKCKDNLIFMAPTELPTLHSGSSGNFKDPSIHKMVAVDIDKGEISWTTDIGRWEWSFWYGFNLRSSDRITSDKPLKEKQLFHVLRDVPGDSEETIGHLAFMDLTNGNILWEKDYEGATRSNVLSDQIFNSFYLKINDENDFSKRALLMFKDGDLKKAVWLPLHYDVVHSEIEKDAIWLFSEKKGPFRLESNDLSVSFGNPGLKDATEWAFDKLGER